MFVLSITRLVDTSLYSLRVPKTSTAAPLSPLCVIPGRVILIVVRGKVGVRFAALRCSSTPSPPASSVLPYLQNTQAAVAMPSSIDKRPQRQQHSSGSCLSLLTAVFRFRQ